MRLKNNRPICPDCGGVMVKAHEQNEEGDWSVRWLCGCKPNLQTIMALEKAGQDQIDDIISPKVDDYRRVEYAFKGQIK